MKRWLNWGRRNAAFRPDGEFHPKEKYALIVIGKNSASGYSDPLECARWHPRITGNLAVYYWELLMTGMIDFGERSPLNTLDDLVGSYEDQQGRRISIFPRDVVGQYISRWECFTKNGGYREVARVWPGTAEVSAEFTVAAKRLSKKSSDDTLTTIIISSHGRKGSIQMGDRYLEYKALLEGLDKIRGKKVVFVYACYSGSFLEALREHPRREDYAAIASCGPDEESTTWGDQALDDFLFDRCGKGGKFSDLDLTKEYKHFLERKGHRKEYYRQPQMLRYFDVRVI